MTALRPTLAAPASLTCFMFLFACSSNDGTGTAGLGGNVGNGGAAAMGGINQTNQGGAASSQGGASGGSTKPTGGVTNGGTVATTGGGTSATGGVSSGGAVAAGGTTSGGSKATGGSTGGGTKATGGSSGGTKATGGSSTGGVSNGGTVTTGGKASGGAVTTGGAQALGGTGAGGATHTGAWKIMPLGDSITASTCYPQLVSKNLKGTGHNNFSFVGTQTNNQSCGAASVPSEGHGGYLVTYLTTNSPPTSGKGTLNELKTWAALKPDAVFMHFGTNDAWNGRSATEILAAYATVLTEFRAQNSKVVFFVAQIIPMNVTNTTCAGCTCPNCTSIITSLNSQVPSWATNNATANSPIYVVDLNTGFATSSDTSDGVHPNPTGSQKMADKMSPAIIANLSGI